MRDIKILSKIEAMQYYNTNTEDNYIIVSISSLNEKDTFYFKNYNENNNCKGIIRLSFNDLEHDYNDSNLAPRQGDFCGLKAFIDTFKDNKDINTIIVHCDAGISRSSALGAVIAQYLGLNEFNLIWNNDKYIPNERVYRLASKEFKLKICEAQLGFYKGIKKQLLDEMELPLNILIR